MLSHHCPFGEWGGSQPLPPHSPNGQWWDSMGFYGRQWKVPGWRRPHTGISTGSGKLLHFWL